MHRQKSMVKIDGTNAQWCLDIGIAETGGSRLLWTEFSSFDGT